MAAAEAVGGKAEKRKERRKERRKGMERRGEVFWEDDDIFASLSQKQGGGCGVVFF